MKKICTSIFLGFTLTSCNSMLQGMAAGMNGGYGGYGGYGYNYGASQYFNTSNYGSIMSAPVSVPNTSWTNSSSYSSGTGTSSGTNSSSSNFCKTCSNTKKCYVCHGSGKRTDNLFGTGQGSTVKCGVCRGTGRCPSCS